MDVTAIADGVEYDLTDGTYCYYMGDDNLGMSPAHRLSERGPLQHGESDRGFRLDARFFRLYLDVEGDSWDDLFTRRSALMDIFRSTDDPVKIRWDFTSFTRQIDCFFASDFGMPSSNREAFGQSVVVGLKASDPTFYDPDSVLTVFEVGAGGGSGFVVPMPVPTEVGESDIDADKTITNSGNFITYPIVTITGPVTDCVITNNTTGEKLDFTGYTVGSSHQLIIDCRYGYKTVETETGTNELDELTTDSDLATFHLEPGGNDFNVTGSSADGDTVIYVRHYDRYLGI